MTKSADISQAPNTNIFSALDRLTGPVLGIFIILLLQTLIWASDFLIPVTAAILGYLVLNQPRRWLERIGVPAIATAAIFTLLLAGFFVVLVLQLSGPFGQFVEDLPNMLRKIKDSAIFSGGTVEAISDATDAAEDMVNGDEADPVAVEIVSNDSYATAVFSMIPGLLSRIGFSLLLLFFLIASGDMFLSKTVESFDRFNDKRRAVEVLHSIEDRLGCYLGGITFINAGLGVAVGVAMHLWGVPNAMIIGVMAFALNFVPFLGGLFGALLSSLVAFVALGGVWPAAGVFGTYIALTSIEGQFITPILISRRMRLNTTVVFLAVAFFAWIWSVMGMVVALPILIVIKIVCDEIEPLKTVGRFLGDIEK